MNGIHRGLIVLGLTVASFAGTVGSTAPAQATFADSAAVSMGSIATATVAAPTQQEARPLCTTTYDPATGTSTTTMTVKIEWWQSASRGVTGYLITAHPESGAPYELTRTGPTDETYYTADPALLASRPRFTITTLTSYGWTARSGMTEVPTC